MTAPARPTAEAPARFTFEVWPRRAWAVRVWAVDPAEYVVEELGEEPAWHVHVVDMRGFTFDEGVVYAPTAERAAGDMAQRVAGMLKRGAARRVVLQRQER